MIIHRIKTNNIEVFTRSAKDTYWYIYKHFGTILGAKGQPLAYQDFCMRLRNHDNIFKVTGEDLFVEAKKIEIVENI